MMPKKQNNDNKAKRKQKTTADVFHKNHETLDGAKKKVKEKKGRRRDSAIRVQVA